MCGIAGIITLKKNNDEYIFRNLKLILNEMHYRGPNDSGIWINEKGNVGLGHNRLSIIDLNKRGKQPMSDHNKKVFTTFNGEIYNFKNLKKKLDKQGYKFKTQTDTEILPYLFNDLNVSNLSKLDGMFAFGLWHEKKKILLLARDFFGKKPLYYFYDENIFVFASELKALCAIQNFSKKINKEALENYLLFQYIPAPLTIYKNVKKLKPGNFLTLNIKNMKKPILTIRNYNKFEIKRKKNSYPYTHKLKSLKDLIISAVEKRLLSDVPLGMFLSGGVDSSIIAAIATKELGVKIKSFSIGFANTSESEHKVAKEISDHLGTEHYQKLIDSKNLFDVKYIASILDEPNGDSSCLPTYLVSKFAKEQVTVALSGDGGDEIFGGYNRYKDTLNEELIWIKKFLFVLKNKKFNRVSDRYLSSRYLIFDPGEIQKILGSVSDKFNSMFLELSSRLNDERYNVLDRMRQIDSEYYLPGAVLSKVDRMSMRNSLEVRSPLLDINVSKFAESLPVEDIWESPSNTKKILKDLAKDYLPAELINLPKKGFGLPSNSWSHKEIIKMVDMILLNKNSYLKNISDGDSYLSIINSMKNKQNFSIYKIWPLLIMECWLKKNLN